MFRRISLVSVFIFLGIATFLYFQCAFLRENDLIRYKASLQEQAEASSSKPNLSSAYQTRQEVRKDIWFTQEDNFRLHHRIESQSSLLTLVPKAQKIDVVENLSQIKCWMQDKLYYTSQESAPMQQVRFLQADEGTYRYLSQRFDAQTVSLSLSRLPGHLLPLECDIKNIFLKGIAKDVSFSISGKTPQFQAQQFKASLKGADL